MKPNCIKAGRFLWYFYPKKYNGIDILFVFKNGDMGGAECVQLEVLKAAQGHTSLTILSHKSKNGHFLNEYSKYTKIEDLSNISHFIVGRWIMAGYIQKTIEKSDIKLIFGSLSGLLYDIAFSIKQVQTKFIDLFHACDSNIEYYSLESVGKLDKRIVIDTNTGKCLKELYRNKGLHKHEDHFQLMNNGVHVPSYFKKEYTADLNVLYVGRDVPIKRVHLIRKIAEQLKFFKFKLVGVPPNLADPKNLNSVGEVKDLTAIYTEAHILLLLSKREGFPMAIMEAMSYGIVPICTNVGGISVDIENGVNGFLIEAEDEEAIVNNAIEILEKLERDREMLMKISEAAYQYAKEHFDIKVFNQKYKDLFHKYVGNKNDG